MSVTIVYWLDLSPEGSERYLQMCLNSVRSLRRVDQTSDVVVMSPGELPDVIERHGARRLFQEDTICVGRPDLEPRFSKYSLFDYDFQEDWVIVLDVDTFINQSPVRLLERVSDPGRAGGSGEVDFAARLESGQTEESVERVNQGLKWSGIQMELDDSWSGNPIYNTGLYLLRVSRAKRLARALCEHLGRDYPCPFRFREQTSSPFSHEASKAGTIRAVKEEAMVSEAVAGAGLTTATLSSQEHGFFWEGDEYEGSQVFHTGGPQYEIFVRWKDPLGDGGNAS